MDGCVYRTKDGECELWETDRNRSPFCNPEHCNNKHPSNADSIRAMTDEELAEKITEIVVSEFGRRGLIGIFDPEDYWLDWLRQEATNG